MSSLPGSMRPSRRRRPPHLQLVLHKVVIIKVGRFCAGAKRLLPDGNAILIAQIQEALVLRVVSAAHIVDVGLLKQGQVSLDLGGVAEG